MFVTEFGEPCEPRNALRAFKAAAKRAGLPSSVGLHTLRHSAASVMMASGVPLKIVSDILGHASVAITGDIYGHVSPDVSREAAAKLGRAERAGGVRPMAVTSGGQTPTSRPFKITAVNFVGLRLGVMMVGASRLELLTPCL